ncbi:MAG: hypothetical protein J6113_05115 [Lachnospiraceae bacterium]|nr:hypothetical protein [Lachnospiraceae bacterium]
MLISNRLKNIIMFYCLGLLAAACTIIFILDSKNTPEPETGPTGTVIAERPTEEPVATEPIKVSASPAPTKALPSPTPFMLVGATEGWNQFVDEMDFEWSEISDKSCVLFRKPLSYGDSVVEGSITEDASSETVVTLTHCAYTEFYYSNLERRAGDHYYASEPPVGSSEEYADNSELVGSLDPKNIASDLYGDPLRKLSSSTLKDKEGFYTITIRMTFNKAYTYRLFETESYFLVVLYETAQ